MKRLPIKARWIGRTERRVVLAILVTAIVPLVAAMGLADRTIRQVSEAAFNPEFDQHLDRALGVYADLAKSMKAAMRLEARVMAADERLLTATRPPPADRGPHGEEAADGPPSEPAAQSVEQALGGLLESRPHVLSVAVQTGDGDVVAEARRPRPLDVVREREFTALSPITGGEEALELRVVFAAERGRLDELESAAEFAQAHRDFSDRHRGEWIDQAYTRTFGALLGATVLLALVVGILVVRPVTRRINHLAAATRPVAAGDLSVRVDSAGRDEIAELARAFNRMLETLESNRARIDFLNRIGEWQTMARRLAHEIKNPLTPIQLAVEECHRRYRGDDAGYRDLLRTTVEIVVEEVGSLRRLVGEFSSFARLPRARLEPGDLAAFLREQQARLDQVELAGAVGDEGRSVELRVAIESDELRAAFDRDMLYRALANLVANGAQASVGIGSTSDKKQGVVELCARREAEQIVLEVGDDGPGIDPTVGTRVFEPYRTTKKSGTGLGLTIVKKIVIEHGGQIDLLASKLGGALFRIRLPIVGSAESDAAMLQSDAAVLSG